MIIVGTGQNAHVVDVAPESWFIVHADNGYDQLQFEIPWGNDAVPMLLEETRVSAEGNYYVVKSIEDKSEDYITYTCDIDLDDWKSTVLTKKRWVSAVFSKVLAEVMPDGWTYEGDCASFDAENLLLEYQEGQPWPAVTPLEILDALAEQTGAIFNFDVPNKVLKVIDVGLIQPSNELFTDELNVVKLDYVGTTDGFATRLYPFGAYDDETGVYVTIDSVNNNVPYVQSNDYADKVVCAWWVDERYEIPANLKAAAVEKVKEMGAPSRSYTVTLNNYDSKLEMYQLVWVIDRHRQVRSQHRVVGIKEYPQAHWLDEVTFSQMPMTFAKLMQDYASKASDELERTRSAVTSAYQAAVKHATELITGSRGGVFQWIFDEQGRPRELVNLGDSDNIETATKVWRWNEAGLGHSNMGYDGYYDLALTKDGQINATMITTGFMSANRIKAGIIESVSITYDELMKLPENERAPLLPYWTKMYLNLNNSRLQSQAMVTFQGNNVTRPVQSVLTSANLLFYSSCTDISLDSLAGGLRVVRSLDADNFSLYLMGNNPPVIGSPNGFRYTTSKPSDTVYTSTVGATGEPEFVYSFTSQSVNGGTKITLKRTKLTIKWGLVTTWATGSDGGSFTI